MSYISDYLDRLYEPPENAQAGYRYTSTGFTILHVTSAPQTDEAAIEYASMVEEWYPKTKVLLIEKRTAGQQEWKLIKHVEEASGQLYVLPAEPVLVQPVPKVSEVPAPDSGTTSSPTTSGTGESDAVRVPTVVVPPPVIPR